MKLIRASVPFLSAVVLATAAAHGTSDKPVTPSNFGDEAIVHRLTQLGYTDVRVVSTADDWVDVTLQRDGRSYTFHASKRPTGPDNLSGSDIAKVVERGLKPSEPNVPR